MIFSGLIYIALGFTPVLFKRMGMPMPVESARAQYGLGICGAVMIIVYILTIGMDGPLRQLLLVFPILVYGVLVILGVNAWQKRERDKSESD